jgi:MFS family permease
VTSAPTTSSFRRRVTLSSRVVRAVLRNPALRRVELAFLLFTGTEFGVWVAVLLYAYAATGAASVGLVVLAQLLPAAFVAPFASSLADRFDRGTVLAGSYVVQAAAYGAAGAGMVLAASPIAVYAAAAVAAMALSATRPTQGSLLPTLARTPEELTAANGVSGTVEGGGLLLGPLAAAAILSIATPGHVFVVGAAACLVAAALVTGLPRPAIPVASLAPVEPELEPHDVHEHVGLLAGLREITRNADTRLLAMALGLRMVVGGAMDVLFVLLALDVLRTGSSGAAVLSAALGAGTVLGGAATFALVGRQRLAPALAASAVTLGLALLLVGLVGSARLALPLVAIGGIGYAACDVVGRTILQRVTPDEVLGRVLGALEGIGLVGLSIGSVAVPILVAIDGIPFALVGAALLLPVGVAAGWRGLARIDRQVLVPTRAITLLRTVPLFAPLPAPQLEAVARRARWMTVDAGTAIIREGDIGDAYYVLESGNVNVTHGEVTLRVYGGYATDFGEIALLHDVLRTATVTALEPCVLLMLERADFLEAVTGHEQVRSIAEQVASDRRQGVA